jgi:putative sugar O-methyltransferase
MLEPAIWYLKWSRRSKTELQTSASDQHPGYLAVCELAARYDSVFRVFKRNRHYRAILEHVTELEGLEYLRAIKDEDAGLIPQYSSIFQENDFAGSPITFDYDVGRFSPTTLRYVKVLADLKSAFGDLGGLDICEIGAGYGGQCKIISDVFDIASYTVIDLPRVLPLIRKYLNRCGVNNVIHLTRDNIKEPLRFDLVLSNYALAECVRQVQNFYLEKILDKARRGYLTYNFPTRFRTTAETSPYGKQEIIERLSKNHSVRVLEEKPSTGPMNFLLIWKD